MIRRRAIVRGMVQGVGFRYNARAEAMRLGLGGYALNRADGAVEVEIEGDAASVERMLAWLAHGPMFAKVDSVDVSDVPPMGGKDFRIAG
ncbi:acylphosphatase [Glaciibacter sp. 2TAF33]|uniref:acylphosphatase n=1 Tax=Glaciibacter sp. 2TAF33 TaxID=3233015 RepID=UPI003F9077BB